MAKEKTSREMASIAARLMKARRLDVRRLAASVLTQYEPVKKKRK